MSASFSIPSPTFCCERIGSIRCCSDSVQCVLSNGVEIRLPLLLADKLVAGDTLSFAVAAPFGSLGREVHIAKRSVNAIGRELYLASVGYAAAPKRDKRDRFFVAAQVREGNLGIISICLPCKLLREHFYRLPVSADASGAKTLYDVLQIRPTASLADLRLASQLRMLELNSDASTHGEYVAVERAFNILACRELRACYDALLADREAPALFPYGGFGTLLVAGERSRDGGTFFAHRIIAFVPECRSRRFRALLRTCDFFEDFAVYRDARRQLQIELDPALLRIAWDATWNRWKHLLGVKMEVEATFVRSGKYRLIGNEWKLITWETALPSRLSVELPTDIDAQLEAARRHYRHLGQYRKFLDGLRAQIERRPVERAELERMCATLRLPGDVDVAQISWHPDYDSFFYRQLARRARRIYLFRDEYIFDLEKAVVAEIPQMGHASYVFSKPPHMDQFLALYAQVTKDDIRRNRGNAAEELGFLGRVVHGTNPRSWLREIKQRVGEKTDFAATEKSEVT